MFLFHFILCTVSCQLLFYKCRFTVVKQKYRTTNDLPCTFTRSFLYLEIFFILFIFQITSTTTVATPTAGSAKRTPDTIHTFLLCFHNISDSNSHTHCNHSKNNHICHICLLTYFFFFPLRIRPSFRTTAVRAGRYNSI